MKLVQEFPIMKYHGVFIFAFNSKFNKDNKDIYFYRIKSKMIQGSVFVFYFRSVSNFKYEMILSLCKTIAMRHKLMNEIC